MKGISLFLIVAFLLVGCQDETSKEGDKYFLQGDYEDAINAYNQYIKVNPSHTKSIYNRGRALEETELYELARKDFEKVLEIDPKHVAACLSMGGYYYRKQDYPGASHYFELAIQNNKDNPESYFLKARSDHKMGLKKVAMNGYDTAIKLNPEYGEAYLYRGALKKFLKQNKSACDDYSKAVALNVEKAETTYKKFCQ